VETPPSENGDQLDRSSHAADEALANAREGAARASRLATAWRKSREDNNFRMMLRALRLPE
jgi:hypothetical protein